MPRGMGILPMRRIYRQKRDVCATRSGLNRVILALLNKGASAAGLGVVMVGSGGFYESAASTLNGDYAEPCSRPDRT